MNENITVIEENQDGFTLIELYYSIKNNIILILAITISFMILAFIYTKVFITPMYTSKVDIQIHITHEATSGQDNAKAQTANQVANNIREYIKFDEIIKPVVSEFYETTDSIIVNKHVKTIKDNLSTAKIGDSTSVRIIFEADDPEVASKLVVMLAEELAERINLPRETDENSLKFATEIITLVNKPEVNPDQEATSPNLILNLIIGLLLGGVISVLLVILMDQFSNSFKSRNDVEKTLSIPVLAVIPDRESELN